MDNYAVIFLAWGERFIKEVCSCISSSETYLEGYDLVLITDENTKTNEVEQLVNKVIRVKFKQQGHLRKTELHKHLPEEYSGFLFLDSDTVVIGDISLGFKKAKIHGIAACPAPHYSLDAFWGFNHIMAKEGMPTNGQLLYNSGVIFFNSSQKVKEVFIKWGILGQLYQEDFKMDQPFFTLAMEELKFNPYTLSISYNYRGYGDSISGDVRIWHSHGNMPKNINNYLKTWPLRRAWPGKVSTNSVEKINGRGMVKNFKTIFKYYLHIEK